jgi:hypothetical protein
VEVAGQAQYSQAAQRKHHQERQQQPDVLRAAMATTLSLSTWITGFAAQCGRRKPGRRPFAGTVSPLFMPPCVLIFDHAGFSASRGIAAIPASRGDGAFFSKLRRGSVRGHLKATFRRSMDSRMTFLRSILRNPAMRLYLLGQLLILVGAWLMDATHSMLPMALAASAALMLMMPLVRQLGARFMAACRRDSERR